MKLLLRLLLLPLKLVTLPFKLFKAATTFLTCVVPLLLLLALAGGAAWFLFIR